MKLVTQNEIKRNGMKIVYTMIGIFIFLVSTAILSGFLQNSNPDLSSFIEVIAYIGGISGVIYIGISSWKIGQKMGKLLRKNS